MNINLPVDLKRDSKGGVVLSGVLIEVDWERSTKSLVRLRLTACDDLAGPTELAVAFREDIREGIHFLTRRPKSLRLTG